MAGHFALSRTSVAPDPDFWSPIRQNYEIFLDPEPDWISILLKPDPDPDYPKRFKHFLIFLRFVFSCENFIDNLRVLMLDDVVYLYCYLIYHAWLTFTPQS